MSHFYSPAELRRVKTIRGKDIHEVTQIINDEFHGGEPIRTPSALKKQGFKFGTVQSWTDEQWSIALEKYQEGLSAAQIGRLIDKSRCAVIGRFFRQGITLKGNTRARSFGVSLSKAGNKRKKPRKKEPQVFDGISDTPEPLSLDTPTRGSTCQYPIGDPKEPSFHFCGHPKTQGSYCQKHYDLCHNTTAPRLGWR